MTKTLLGIAIGAAALLALGSARAQILRGGGEAGDYMRSHPDTRSGHDSPGDRGATQSLHDRDKQAEETRENSSRGASRDLRGGENKELRDSAGLNNPADMQRGKRPDARDDGGSR